MKKKFTTTKLIMFFLFLNCTIIELFTGWVTIQSMHLAEVVGTMPDFSPLITLIGTVVGEVIGFSTYALKSVKENTVGGIIYDTALQNNNSIDNEESIE